MKKYFVNGTSRKMKANPFEIEKKRSKYASENDYINLLKLYNPLYPEISDHNTPKLWNKLNLIDKPKIIKNPMESERLEYVVHLITGSKFSLLNIGFGSANLERLYFKRYSNKKIRWDGIDISDKSVEEAKKYFLKCNFEIGDILKIKAKNETYNYVVSLEVLEHIKPSKIFKAMNEIYRVLKPGGKFIASVPLNEGLEEMIKLGTNPNAHVRMYTPELIKAELEIAGFKILKQKELYAFHNLHSIKSFIADNFLKNKYLPNNIIVVSQKQ